MPSRPATPKPRRVKLKPADSFDLIRLLARSQSDPRKAVCELVQNSLDAGARRIDVTWQNEKGVRVLRVWDDGAGVFPELSREDALRRIATTIGHSHKRDLTPAQRRELMALGKYGIGLLGFWSVGQHMEIRTRVGGGEIFALRLEVEKPDASIERVRARRIDDAPTFTEVVIRSVHEGAARQVRPGRLQAYLASELRGQLLGREVDLAIEDKVARGLALKHFVVRPTRFLGRALSDLRTLEVHGHEEARLELYLVSADEPRTGRVQLACGGTTVLDDLAEAFDEGSHPPWNTGRIEGVIDFPELEVAPSTRRGFQRDEAALAFLDALAPLEMELCARLNEEDQSRAAEKQKSVAREIRRAFRRVALALPEYDLFDIRARAGSAAGEGAQDGVALPGDRDPAIAGPAAARSREAESGSAAPSGAMLEPAEPPGAPASAPGEAGDEEPSLFPPGPLARVRVQPANLRVAPGALRTLKARALDQDGRTCADEVEWTWTLEGPGILAAEGPLARFAAADEPGRARILVRARSAQHEAEASVAIEVQAELAAHERVSGIPEPETIEARGEPWRSRFSAGRWQVNRAHRDWIAAHEASEARGLRYVLHLFVKEVVLRNFGGPADAALLERMVEVLTHLEERSGARES